MSPGELSPSARAAYVRLIEQRFGLRLVGTLAKQLDGVVMRLLATSDYTAPGDLYDAFAAGQAGDLLEVLGARLTVGETYFFRVTPQMQALRDIVLPGLIARHAVDRRLRVWSAGCSTGEEPYTLAMLIREALPAPQGWDIQLVASDLNRDAIDVARQAVYGDWSFRDAPTDVRDRYFTRSDKRWQLIDAVRNMVRFVHLNLADDAFPFACPGEPIDLILCRNVTIYFHEMATQRLYQRFGKALEPSGWLVLGPSDPVPAPSAGFELVVLEGALLWRHRLALPQLATPRPPVASVPVAPTPIRRVAADQNRVEQPRVAGAPLRRGGTTPARLVSMDAQDYLSAGIRQLNEGAAMAAIDNLRRAAFLDETNALVQFSLGRAYRQNGDAARSRSAFRRARRLLAGSADDQLLVGSEVVTGELRGAVDAQLADLDRNRP